MNTRDIEYEAIAMLAYHLWEERGRPIGSPEIDWDRAEETLRRGKANPAETRGMTTDGASARARQTASEGGAGVAQGSDAAEFRPLPAPQRRPRSAGQSPKPSSEQAGAAQGPRGASRHR
jgi:hypothetical protein